MKLSEMTINELKRELKTYESNLVISTEDLGQKYREVMAIDLKDPDDLDDIDQKESIKLSGAILTVEKKIASYKRYIVKIKKELELKRKELTKLVNYKIYQIKLYDDNKNHIDNNYVFFPYDFAKNNGFKFEDYELVYDANKQVEKNYNKKELLEHIFEVFNIKRPGDFKGRSLSVSDIVVIENKYIYYTDSIGFKEFKEKFENTPLKSMKRGNYGK